MVAAKPGNSRTGDEGRRSSLPPEASIRLYRKIPGIRLPLPDVRDGSGSWGAPPCPAVWMAVALSYLVLVFVFWVLCGMAGGASLAATFLDPALWGVSLYLLFSFANGLAIVLLLLSFVGLANRRDRWRWRRVGAYALGLVLLASNQVLFEEGKRMGQLRLEPHLAWHAQCEQLIEDTREWLREHPDHPWAGEYTDAKGYTTYWIREEQPCLLRWSYDSGPDPTPARRACGTEYMQIWIEFEPPWLDEERRTWFSDWDGSVRTLPDTWPAYMRERYVVVPWGERRYFLSSSDLRTFRSDVEGFEIGTLPWYRTAPLLRVGDEAKPLVGEPELPRRKR